VTGWLRRNRWGLLVVPIAAAALVAGNAQRLHDYWWVKELRVVGASGQQGSWVHYSEPFSDALGASRLAVDLEVVDVRTVGSISDPIRGEVKVDTDGAMAYAVKLRFRADPKTVLIGCRMALLDAAGNRYDFDHQALGVAQDLYPCLQDGAEGYGNSIRVDTPRAYVDGPRPATWTTRPVVIVPAGVRITEVRLWWDDPGPRYCRVSVTPAG